MKTALEHMQAEHLRVKEIIDRDAEIAEWEEIYGPVGPTPETLDKLALSNVEVLYNKHVIDHDDVKALTRIQDAFRLITSPVRVRLASMERVDNGQRSEDYTEHQFDVLKDYKGWQREIELEQFKITIDVAVSGLSLNQIAKDRNYDKRTVKELLKDSLEEYGNVWRRNHPRLTATTT